MQKQAYAWVLFKVLLDCAYSDYLCLQENGPTFVGDERSDPELMHYLTARKVTEPGNNFSTYLTDLNVRMVLDLLETRGYRLVGMSGMGQTCVWTMWKSIN